MKKILINKPGLLGVILLALAIYMLKNFDSYAVEGLQVPTLILHAKDDKMAKYSDTEKAVPRFPDCTFISFESGGHLMAGHGEEIQKAVAGFMK